LGWLRHKVNTNPLHQLKLLDYRERGLSFVAKLDDGDFLIDGWKEGWR